MVMFLFLPGLLSQTFEIYTGVNIGTGIKYNEYYHSEPTYRQLSPRIFPLVGYRFHSKISQYVSVIYGLEFCKIGASEYYLDDQVILDRYNFDSFIDLSQIKINTGVSIKVYKKLYVEGGYTLAYTFDKNVNFIFIEDEMNIIWKSAYMPFSHICALGINVQFDRFKLRCLYNFGLSPIYDTGKNFTFDNNLYPDWKREKLRLNYLNIAIGYKL